MNYEVQVLHLQVVVALLQSAVITRVVKAVCQQPWSFLFCLDPSPICVLCNYFFYTWPPGYGISITMTPPWFVLKLNIQLLQEQHPPWETSFHAFQNFQWSQRIMVRDQLKAKAIQVGMELLDYCHWIKCSLLDCRVVLFSLLQLSATICHHSSLLCRF